MTLFTKKENEGSEEAKKTEGSSLGERLSAARKKKGLTQEDFARQLDVTPQAVSKWENDQSCPDIMLLPKISEILGLGIDKLLTGSEQKADIPKMPQTDTSRLKLKIKISPLNKKPTNVTVPVAVVKKAARIGNGISGILGNSFLNSSQLEEILELAEEGATGELIKIEADDGTVISVEISK